MSWMLAAVVALRFCFGSCPRSFMFSLLRMTFKSFLLLSRRCASDRDHLLDADLVVADEANIRDGAMRWHYESEMRAGCRVTLARRTGSSSPGAAGIQMASALRARLCSPRRTT